MPEFDNSVEELLNEWESFRSARNLPSCHQLNEAVSIEIAKMELARVVNQLRLCRMFEPGNEAEVIAQFEKLMTTFGQQLIMRILKDGH